MGRWVMGCYCDETKRQLWTSESSLGAVLKLRQEDWVYVNVSVPDLINRANPYGNYFGLYQIV